MRRPPHRFRGVERPTCSEACWRIVLSNVRKLAPRGGEYVDDHGYALVLQPTHARANRRGYVRKAWLVVEERDNRALDAGEIVVFQDGDRTNLAPANLVRVRRRARVA